MTLTARRQNLFSVLGGVARPGAYEVVRKDMRLLEALAQAGGRTQVNFKYILVIRPAPPMAAPPCSQVPAPATKQTPTTIELPPLPELPGLPASGTAPSTGTGGASATGTSTAEAMKELAPPSAARPASRHRAGLLTPSCP